MADSKISALPASTTPLAGTEVLPVVQSSSTKQVSVANLTAGRAVSAGSLALTTSPLSATSGGTGTATAFTAGSVLFAGASGVYSQNNANFFWNNSNITLGIGTASPSSTPRMHVYGATPRIWCEYNSTGSLLELGADSASAFVYNRNNQPLDFGANNSLKWRIETDGSLTQKVAAKGIDFTANSAQAGMTSQLLNWYEEGTWTPSLTSATGTITTVGAKTAYYTRIGRLVTLNMNVVITTNGTGATALLLGSLPFAISTTNTTGAGIEQAVSGKALAISSYNSTTLYVTFYDFTYPGADGARIVVSVTYPI